MLLPTLNHRMQGIIACTHKTDRNCKTRTKMSPAPHQQQEPQQWLSADLIASMLNDDIDGFVQPLDLFLSPSSQPSKVFEATLSASASVVSLGPIVDFGMGSELLPAQHSQEHRQPQPHMIVSHPDSHPLAQEPLQSSHALSSDIFDKVY